MQTVQQAKLTSGEKERDSFESDGTSFASC